MADQDVNHGEGWYEFIHPTKTTTHICHVFDNGDVYLPEEGTTYEDFVLASSRGYAYRLIRAEGHLGVPLTMEGRSKDV